MKSAHRHDLETNELARRLAVWIEVIRPYSTAILTVVLVILVAIAGTTYYQRSTAARASEAWDAYHLAVEDPQIDLESLKQAAERNAGTAMAAWADMTWADGQLYTATRTFVLNREAALEQARKAQGVYQRMLDADVDSSLKDRARFGLGRVCEMRNELDKAREYYASVTGGFAELAKARIEELDKPNTIVDYAWLATAEPPVRPSPGATGDKPLFDAEGFDLSTDNSRDEGPQLGELLESFGRSEETDANRYGEGESGDSAEEKPPTGDDATELILEEPTGDSSNESASDTDEEAGDTDDSTSP